MNIGNTLLEMATTVPLDVALASPPFFLGLAITWRLIWPRWKVVGKIAFYFAGVATLSYLVGHWSVLVGWLHQSAGLAFHIRFCHRHGFTWYRVEDPERYVALSKESVDSLVGR